MITLRRVFLALALVLACCVEQTAGREDCSKAKFVNTCLKKYYGGKVPPHKDRVIARHANKSAKESGKPRHSAVPKPAGGKHPSSTRAAKLAGKSSSVVKKTTSGAKKKAPRRSGGLFKWSSSPDPEPEVGGGGRECVCDARCVPPHSHQHDQPHFLSLVINSSVTMHMHRVASRRIALHLHLASLSLHTCT